MEKIPEKIGKGAPFERKEEEIISLIDQKKEIEDSLKDLNSAIDLERAENLRSERYYQFLAQIETLREKVEDLESRDLNVSKFYENLEEVKQKLQEIYQESIAKKFPKIKGFSTQKKYKKNLQK